MNTCARFTFVAYVPRSKSVAFLKIIYNALIEKRFNYSLQLLKY